MRVRVLTFGSLREQAGAALGEPLDVDLEAGAIVADAIAALGIDASRVYSILLDGQRCELQQALHDDAELTLMPAFAGGDR